MAGSEHYDHSLLACGHLLVPEEGDPCPYCELGRLRERMDRISTLSAKRRDTIHELKGRLGAEMAARARAEKELGPQ